MTIPNQRTPGPADTVVLTAPPRHRQRTFPYRGIIMAIALYAALRLVTLAVLAIYANADPDHSTLRGILTDWDAEWYGRIAEDGYDESIPLDDNGKPKPTNLAFFPLYPFLVATAKFILPIHVTTALLLVSWACGLLAAAALYGIGAQVRDSRTGILLVGLWAVTPHAVVLSMGYSEPLFTALAAGALLFVLRRNWLAAGALCVLAGLTRPTAAALIAAVGLAALLEIIRRPVQWRPWAAMALAPLGLLGYVAWVGDRLGRIDGYFYVQNVAWKMAFDGGAYTLRTVNEVLTRPKALEIAEVTLVLLLAILLFGAAIGERLPWPLLVYGGACLAIVLTGDGFYWAKARHLIPAFPLLLPIAYAITRSRNRTLPYLVIGGMAVFCGFWSVYLTLQWNHSF